MRAPRRSCSRSRASGSYPILLAGTEAQKPRWLPSLARGETVPAFALTEPEAGSDAAALATRAELRGDHWALTGAKHFISNAPVASLYVVFARTGSGARRQGPLGLRRPEGRARPHRGADAHARPPRHRRAHASTTAASPRTTGSAPRATAGAWRWDTLDVFRASVGAQAVGLGQAALDLALAHARRRTQFGQPIAQFQAIQAKLADMATELRAARLLVYSAARLRDAGAARVTLESAMAKLFATEVAHRVVDQAVQIHGGAGVLRGSPIERLYREVRAPRIYEGTSEIQRLIIARQLLREADGAG